MSEKHTSTDWRKKGFFPYWDAVPDHGLFTAGQVYKIEPDPKHHSCSESIGEEHIAIGVEMEVERQNESEAHYL